MKKQRSLSESSMIKALRVKANKMNEAEKKEALAEAKRVAKKEAKEAKKKK